MSAASEIRAYLLGRPAIAALVADGVMPDGRPATDGEPWLFVRRLRKTEGMPRMAVVLTVIDGNDDVDVDQGGALSSSVVRSIAYGADSVEADRVDEAVKRELHRKSFGSLDAVRSVRGPIQRHDPPPAGPGWDYTERYYSVLKSGS